MPFADQEKRKTTFTDGKKEINPTEDDTEIVGTVTAAIRLYKGNEELGMGNEGREGISSMWYFVCNL